VPLQRLLDEGQRCLLVPHPAHPLSADLSNKQRTEPASPKPHRLVANVYAALEQQVLDIPEA
jgi:hypothetical protein